uniref:Uncharacterized protein n=1 Tax=Anguilla anguilla TaxID=7936 RepID=A0A0E9PQ26_ANGAN
MKYCPMRSFVCKIIITFSNMCKTSEWCRRTAEAPLRRAFP